VVTFSPAIIGTFPLNEKADISLIAQYQISSNNYNDFLGLSLGFGFSNDLSKWAIRPEIGYQFDTWYMDGTGYFNFGLSCAYSFDIIK
jgi:hypothetical protein